MADVTYEKMDPEQKRIWVEALRSGVFQQGMRSLFDFSTGRFCCLGVNLKVVHGFAPATNEHDACFPALPEGHWSDKVAIDHNAIQELIKMNDNGKSFNEIAGWIEEHL